MPNNDRSRSKLTDKILYCERCGISFLWTSEEQEISRETSESAQPKLCPGCRHLLPDPGRERGLVKWFSYKRGYGFIARHEGPDLFVHRSEIKPGRRLRPGNIVEFDVAEGERGPAATQVEILES